MNLTLWVGQVVLAVVFFLSGTVKLFLPSEKLRARLPEVRPVMIRLVSVAEIVGALGLILPGITGIAPVLTPLAAAGLGIIMVGAVLTHARRHETTAVVTNLVLLVLTFALSVGRFVLPL